MAWGWSHVLCQQERIYPLLVCRASLDVEHLITFQRPRGRKSDDGLLKEASRDGLPGSNHSELTQFSKL